MVKKEEASFSKQKKEKKRRKGTIQRVSPQCNIVGSTDTYRETLGV
jgi:hypothetical protein